MLFIDRAEVTLDNINGGALTSSLTVEPSPFVDNVGRKYIVETSSIVLIVEWVKRKATRIDRLSHQEIDYFHHHSLRIRFIRATQK